MSGDLQVELGVNGALLRVVCGVLPGCAGVWEGSVAVGSRFYSALKGFIRVVRLRASGFDKPFNSSHLAPRLSNLNPPKSRTRNPCSIPFKEP